MRSRFEPGRAPQPASGGVTVGDVYRAVVGDSAMRGRLDLVYDALFGAGGDRPDHFAYVKPSRARCDLAVVGEWIGERYGRGCRLPRDTPFGYLSSPATDGWVVLFSVLHRGADMEISRDFWARVARTSWRAGAGGATSRHAEQARPSWWQRLLRRGESGSGGSGSGGSGSGGSGSGGSGSGGSGGPAHREVDVDIAERGDRPGRLPITDRSRLLAEGEVPWTEEETIDAENRRQLSEMVQRRRQRRGARLSRAHAAIDWLKERRARRSELWQGKQAALPKSELARHLEAVRYVRQQHPEGLLIDNPYRPLLPAAAASPPPPPEPPEPPITRDDPFRKNPATLW